MFLTRDCHFKYTAVEVLVLTRMWTHLAAARSIYFRLGVLHVHILMFGYNYIMLYIHIPMFGYN